MKFCRRSRNLCGLSRHDPLLAEKFQAACSTGTVTPFRGAQSYWTAWAEGRDGGRCLLHSSTDPFEDEVRGLRGALPQSWMQGRAPQGAICLIVGLGMGWPALAAAALLPQNVAIWAADPAREAFSMGLDVLDMDRLWERRRLRLFLGGGEPSAGLNVAGAVTVSVTQGPLDASDPSRSWTTGFLRTLVGVKAPPMAHREGLPDWLGMVLGCRLDSELP